MQSYSPLAITVPTLQGISGWLNLRVTKTSFSGLINLSFKAAYGLIVREKRRYFRCPVEVPVAILRTALPAVHGSTVNVSEGGMSIAANASLDLATRYSCSSLCQVMNSSLSLKPRCAGRISRRSECVHFLFSASSLQAARVAFSPMEETIPQSVREQFSKLPKE